MIIEWLVKALLDLITGVLGFFLPDVDTALGFTIPGGVLRGYAFLNTFLPVPETLACVGAWFAVQGYMQLFSTVKMIVNWIRGAGA